MEQQFSKNFSLTEFVKTQTGLDNIPGPLAIESLRKLVVNIMQPLRDALGVPITITSGFRSGAVNEAIGGAKSSQHKKGEACDFVVDGYTPTELIAIIKKLHLPYDQVIDENLKGRRWVHVSYGSLNRREHLLAVDGPDGKAKYVRV